MKTLLLLMIALVLSCTSARAAFEPVFESPWLQGGVASALFPRTPLVIMANPACLGLLEGHGVAVSAARPFGLQRLDRTAAAGCLMLSSYALAASFSLSGDESYSEARFGIATAWKLTGRVVAGAGVSIERLQISGYSRATGASADVAALWSPVEGIFGTIMFRSVLRTDIGSSGDPAAPRSIELALGIVPVDKVLFSAGAARQEELDLEYTFHTSFSPAPAVSITTGLKTDPARFWAALEISLSSLGIGYGYGEHASLPGTHSIALCWGDCGSAPSCIQFQQSSDEDEQPEVLFPLDVNAASEDELQLIPGIGPSKASAIAAWLRQNGPVISVDDLQSVPGIGPSILEVLNEYLEVR